MKNNLDGCGWFLKQKNDPENQKFTISGLLKVRQRNFDEKIIGLEFISDHISALCSLFGSNHANLLMSSTKVKATQPWSLDFRFEAHSSMHSSGVLMLLTVFRWETEPSPSAHPMPLKTLPFGSWSEIIVEKNELQRCYSL